MAVPDELHRGAARGPGLPDDGNQVTGVSLAHAHDDDRPGRLVGPPRQRSA